MAETKKLIKQRTSIKSQLTRFKRFLETYNNEKSQLLIRMKSCENLFESFNAIQLDIETITDCEEQIEERAAFEEMYFELLSKAQELLSEDSTVNNENQNSNNASVLNNIKLPTIELPSFSGAYDQWLQFYDTFNSLIHNNTNLNDIQKFHYLKSAIKGEAASVIHSIEVSADNYATAWTLLKDRFENKKLIIFNHVKAIFDLPNITKESHASLRTFLDSITKNLRALETLEQPVDKWDTILLYLFSIKLDVTSKREWEKSIISCTSPSMKDFKKFITERCQLLETINNSKVPNNTYTHANKSTNHIKRVPISSTYITSNNIQENFKNISCTFCKQAHAIFYCNKFLSLPVPARITEIKKLKLCLNCLRSNHTVPNCISSGCRRCNKRHNTLLHLSNVTNHDNAVNSTFQTSNQTNDEPSTSQQINSIEAIQTTCSSTQQDTFSSQYQREHTQHVLLATAIIYIIDKAGNAHKARALLDSASQSNFITSKLSNILNLTKHNISVPIVGINQNVTQISQRVTATIKSTTNNYCFTSSFLILDNITNNLPMTTINIRNLDIPENILLADPTFYAPGKIDLLIGASVFYDLLCVGQIKLANQKTIVQKTQLGWVISGPVPICNQNQTSLCNLVTNIDIQNQLQHFWELEECNNTLKHNSSEEKICEQIFLETTKRNSEGRFVVDLPIRDQNIILGESKQLALKRLEAVERKFIKNLTLKHLYHNFMQEYESLGHMSEVSDSDHAHLSQNNIFYLPHHCVLRETNQTTKCRVVFDGSAKTCSGQSLNDILLVGPTIQEDIFSIILRFRKYPFVITADVTKMYRQILINPNQRNFQRILWRYNNNDPVKTYQLNTVTYGTSSASFLAIRCLYQIGLENQQQYPRASEVIKTDFYVDDVLTGANTVQEVILLKQQLETLLGTSGFELSKWKTNEPSILNSNSNADNKLTFCDQNQQTKTLGLIWDPATDVFQFENKYDTHTENATKRSILSTISQIFDPLGLIGPVTVKAKIMLQHLWQLNLTWDESLPLNLHTMWIQYRQRLQEINKITIPRNIMCNEPINLQIHGFCDSSESAYGSCVYLRSTNKDGQHFIYLLCSKSRVAPLKRTTLPRLELCGALLLSKLVNITIKSLKLSVNQTFYWCDSTIALTWIAGQPSNWQTFVANRVSQIQELTNISEWKHVRSQSNPADIISRGMNPTELSNSCFWWHGPSWLAADESEWPCDEIIISDVPEKRKTNYVLTSTNLDFTIFNKYSSLIKLLRVVAYIQRFYFNCIDKQNKYIGPLSSTEIDNALNTVLKLAQYQSFPEEIQLLKNNKQLQKSSKLLSLTPFLDKNGLLRVGGRLKLGNFSFDQKHPILLSNKHPLTILIIRNEHYRALHAGTNALLAAIRTRFWIVSGKSTVKQVLHKCIVCFKCKPTELKYIMGNLPRERITPCRPFLNCGVDYAGPFLIKANKLRHTKYVKAYLCIFICFSSKAVHLEIVNDLSTKAFLNCLKRFVARRGKPSNIYSDNATNFVGAKNEIKQLYKLIQNNQQDIINHLSPDRISWHNIPPRSPNFGGIWESSIKSAKAHLIRIAGNASLTYEDFNTIITQIEACMNSRPLTELSNDPNDFTVLTPGHFLIGSPLTSIPELNVQQTNSNRLDQYHRLVQLKQHFWSRWSKEYISELQQRRKWKSNFSNILKPGSLVIVKEDNLPPLNWKLGRVTELFPGKDKIVRVVKIKTSGGEIVRAVNKICALPLDL